MLTGDCAMDDPYCPSAFNFPLPGYAFTGRKVSGHRDVTPNINFVARCDRMCNVFDQ
jgi:hypothetical protein